MTADLEELDRARANKRRLAQGLPAWNFDQARPVPSPGTPPVA